MGQHIFALLWQQSVMTSCVSRKYRRAQSIAKIVLTLDDIVFIDTQVSRKVSVGDPTVATLPTGQMLTAVGNVLAVVLSAETQR